jgi:hypothetical protein
MFGQMLVTRMFESSKLETVDDAVARAQRFGEYPKARAYDAHSCQAGKKPPLNLPTKWLGIERYIARVV